jgi:hypothetical protein
VDLVGTLESMIEAVPSGGFLYDTMKYVVTDSDEIPKAIDSWCDNKIQ